MIKKILNSRTKTVTFGAILLAFFGFLSRILGLFRDNLLANLLEKQQADIYFAAFRIPDFVYGIFITGGIVAAFLPVFANFYKKDKKEAQILTNNVLSAFLIILLFVCSVLIILTPSLVNLIVPGFGIEQKKLVCVLTRIMFLSPVVLGLSSIFGSLLQYFNLFVALSLAPIFYNLGIIFGILVLLPIFGMVGLAYGVIVGAILHFLIQIFPILKLGFRPSFFLNLHHPGLRKIFSLMLPRTIGIACSHINLIVITSIASTLGVGSIRIFNFANNLQGVVIGLFGVSFSTAVFPVLSRLWAQGNKKEFLSNLYSVFSQILFWVIPCSVLAFVLRNQIVRVVLGTSVIGKGFFDWWDTKLTAGALGIFSLSLFASCLVLLISRAFFALCDTKTPVKIAVFSMIFNIILCYLFVWLFGFPNIVSNFFRTFLSLKEVSNIRPLGLIVAFSFATIFQFFLLIFYLRKKISDFSFKRIWLFAKKIFYISFLTGIFTYSLLKIFAKLFNLSQSLGVFLQGSLAAIGGIVFYLTFAYLLKLKEIKAIFSSILVQFKK